MKQFIFIHTLKFSLIAFLIWLAISKYDSTHNPIQQSLWFYMFIYLPAVVGFVNLIHMAFKSIVNKVRSWK